MTKIRKLKKKKKYQYDINRKRMNKKRLPGIESTTILKSWNSYSSSQKNFKKMGLVFDINSDIKHMNTENNFQNNKIAMKKTRKTSVIQDLETNAETSSKGMNFRFSKDQAEYLSYLLEKYGNDYKAMSKDKKNYLQHTWKQLRHKINLFRSSLNYYKKYIPNKYK